MEPLKDINQAQRILILGCSGAGKSTLARQLSQQLGLPIIHLDQHFWKAGWKQTAPLEWSEKVKVLCKDPKWIMDGNYGGTLSIRIPHADVIIVLDMSRWRCLYRVIKRTIKYWGRARPDMVAGCPERMDWIFFMYILQYQKKHKPRLWRQLNKVQGQVPTWVLKSPKEVHHFLEKMGKAPFIPPDF